MSKIGILSFGKKEDRSSQSQEPSIAYNQGPQGPPTDHVIAMQQQGLTNSQIIEYLQRQGYTPDEVFEAMSQASVKGSVENMNQDFFSQQPMQPQQAQQAQQPLPPMPPPQQYQPMMREDTFQDSNEHIERVAEAIIEEKWNEMTKYINKIVEWKDKTESRVTKMEQQIVDMKKGFDSLHDALLGKVNEYDQNIVHLGVEIKAMEKVFQNILPSLTDSVSELSRITKDMKK